MNELPLGASVAIWPGGPGDGADIGIEEVAGEPVAGCVGGQWLPGVAAVARGENAGWMEGRTVAERDAAFAVEEFHAT